MIETSSVSTFYCDGPDCEVTVTTQTDATRPPTGWLKMYGPSEQLGEFHFHCGMCYDNWLLNVENHLAQLQAERQAAQTAAEEM